MNDIYNKENEICMVFQNSDVKISLQEWSKGDYRMVVYDSDDRFINDWAEFGSLTDFVHVIDEYATDPKYGNETNGIVNMIWDSFGDDMVMYRNPRLNEILDLISEYGKDSINRIGSVIFVSL